MAEIVHDMETVAGPRLGSVPVAPCTTDDGQVRLVIKGPVEVQFPVVHEVLSGFGGSR